MLWVFVILGALTLVAVLFGMLKSWAGRRSLVFIDLTSLVLVMAAWSLGHQSTMGRVALAAAITLEVLAWMVGRDQQVELAESESEAADAIDAHGEPVTYGEPVNEAELGDEFDGDHNDGSHQAGNSPSKVNSSPTTTEQAEALEASMIGLGQGAVCVRAMALLARPYHLTPDVFLASLKRAGLRAAQIVRSNDDSVPTYIAYEGVRFGVDVSEAPLERSVMARVLARESIDSALRDACKAHAAYFAVDVAFDHETPRALVARYLTAAHVALSEFAPVVAMLLTESATVVAAGQLRALLERLDGSPASAADLCVVNRSFKLDEANGGFDLLDTLGLTTFGLPDLQLILRGAATMDEAALTRDALCEQFLGEGCHLLHGTDLVDEREIAWRVSYRRSAFDPDREVVQLIEQGRDTTRSLDHEAGRQGESTNILFDKDVSDGQVGTQNDTASDDANFPHDNRGMMP